MIKLQHVNFRTDAFVGPFRYCVSLGPIMLPPLNSLNQTFNVHGILRCFTIFMSPPPIIRHARSIDKLQRVHSILARVVARAPWTSISLTISRDLHWLHVGHRITYKPCLTAWKTLHTSQPLYHVASFLTIFHQDPCFLAFFQYRSPYQTTSYY